MSELTERFFVDHGTIHDRKTGRHVGEDRLEECCSELNALALNIFDAEVGLRAQLDTALRERDEAREVLDEVRHFAAVLLKAINDDEEHGIDNATVRAVVALRLAISKTGSVNSLAAIRGTEGK